MKWNVLLAFVVLIIAAFAPMNPVSTWVSADAEQTTGAPAVYAGPDQLAEARRAAGDAGAQAGFLTSGTKQLKEGTEQLKGGSGQLAEGIRAASEGANQLSQGMVELQAGTGQLADGATRLADSVGGAVDQVAGFDAARGQILAAIDDALGATRGSRDPEVAKVREQLTGLRKQVETAEMPSDMTSQLNELKNGSRELANQLSVPGYAYHDGVYSATNGAQELSRGLNEMNGRVGEATDGVNQLADGAVKVDDMANKTKDQIGAVQRAMPAPPPVTGTAEAAENAPESALAPLAAMLVAALSILGGVVTALAAYAGSRPRARWMILGLGCAFTAVAGIILVAILGTALSPLAVVVSSLALALGTLASAGITWILRSAFGTIGGGAAAGILGLLQVGLVGWVWSSAATGDVGTVWRTASSALPMHWTTTAISAAGNNGSNTALLAGLGFAAVLAAIGLVAINMDNRALGAVAFAGGTPADASYRAAKGRDEHVDAERFEVEEERFGEVRLSDEYVADESYEVRPEADARHRVAPDREAAPDREPASPHGSADDAAPATETFDTPAHRAQNAEPPSRGEHATESFDSTAVRLGGKRRRFRRGQQ